MQFCRHVNAQGLTVKRALAVLITAVLLSKHRLSSVTLVLTLC